MNAVSKKLQVREGNPFVLRVPSEEWYGCYDTPRTSLFTRESNRHPAKMAVGLCFRILEHGERRGYWKPGDTILDPMAGIGTTLVCAQVRGYRVVGVELERHFYDLALGNLQALRERRNLMAHWELICNDARNLPALLADGALTSPPYGDSHCGGEGETQLAAEGRAREIGTARTGQGGRGRHGLQYGAAVSSPPYSDCAVIQGAGVTHRILTIAREQGMAAAVAAYRADVMDRQKAHGRWSDENIQRHIEMALASAENGGYAADGAMASPPYPSAFREGHPGTHGGKVAQEFERGGAFRGYTGAVSSPPYSAALEGGGIAQKGHTDDAALAERQYMPSRHGEAPAQIGNLRDPVGDIDAVLSSPPWENQTRGGVSAAAWSDPAKAAEISAARYRSGERKGHPATAQAIQAAMERDAQHENYGEAPGQIGRERGETYCSAMLQVYRGLWQVLRPGAVVALVTKNPVKDRKLRRLDLDTIRLMEHAGPQGAPGFTLLEHHHAMLSEEKFPLFPGTAKRERKSFFKRLYERNGGIRVDWEDVLFFRRVP